MAQKAKVKLWELDDLRGPLIEEVRKIKSRYENHHQSSIAKKQESLLIGGYRDWFRKDGRSNHIHHQSSITKKIKSRYENQSSITPAPNCRGINSKDQKIKSCMKTITNPQ